jgi:TATA-binding protein-associated factor
VLTFCFCRLDRLLTLLDTGSSSSVRATAARQIAQIAVKAVRHDVSSEDTVDVDDSPHKPDPRHETDSDGWGEVMAVVTKVSKCF